MNAREINRLARKIADSTAHADIESFCLHEGEVLGAVQDFYEQRDGVYVPW